MIFETPKSALRAGGNALLLSIVAIVGIVIWLILAVLPYALAVAVAVLVLQVMGVL